MKIVKTTYKDQVIEHIYDLVLEGTLAPGDQIKEIVLAEEMGISRAPIREALKELITNGIIIYKPQVGSFVAQLSKKEIVDAYTTRGVLEGYATMENRDSFSPEEIEKLEHIVYQMEKSAKKNQHKMVIQLGGDFHDLLISKNKNIQLMDYSARLSQKLHILFYRHWGALYSPEEIGSRHLTIIHALKSQDQHKIEQAVRDHYTETGTKIAQLQ